LRFKLVKTNFHSGRLLVVFIPYDARFSLTTVNVTQAKYANRAVLDIREGNEFTFLFPYVASQPYMNYGDVSSYGLVKVYTLDPLTAPDSVMNNITVLVEVFGGPDMEFAIPRTPPFVPITVAAPQSNWRPDCAIVDAVIGDAQVLSDSDHTYARAIIGEKILSFRTLLKFANYRAPLIATTSGSIGVVTPFAVDCYTSTAGLLGKPLFTIDMYSRLGCAYLLSRGGVRFKFEPTTSSNSSTQPTHTQTYFRPYKNVTTPGDSILWNAGQASLISGLNVSPIMSTDLAATGAIECECPSYGRFHSRINSELLYPQPGHTQLSANTHFPMYDVYVESDSAFIPRIWRGGADDIDFGCFISVPPHYPV